MNNIKSATPDGMKDYLFEECEARGIVENTIINTFESYGYAEVITSPFEYYDVFNLKSKNFQQETMYKFTDFKGKLIVARPDCTIPIARLAATRLREEINPIKLYYSQNIFRVNPKNAGCDDQIWQSGIELIGGDREKADEEVLMIAIDLISAFDTENYKLELCDVSFFKTFIADLGVDDDEAEKIRVLIKNKNFPDLHAEMEKFERTPAAIALREMPSFFGGEDDHVFEVVRKYLYTDDLRKRLNKLETLFHNLKKFSGENTISIDLGLVSKIGYYTGILFRGYIQEYGMAILSGGRYDDLLSEFGADICATGLAVNVNAATRAFLSRTDKELRRIPHVLVYGEDNFEALAYCKKLIKEGYVVTNADVGSEQDAFIYARSMKIKRIDVIRQGKVNTNML